MSLVKVPARDPSDTTFCQDDKTLVLFLKLWTSSPLVVNFQVETIEESITPMLEHFSPSITTSSATCLVARAIKGSDSRNRQQARRVKILFLIGIDIK